MHLVHHPQLHYRVLVVVDCLVVEPHGDIDPRRAQRHDRRDAVAHVEVAARMAGDGDVPAPHQPYLGLGNVNRMAIDDVALHQTKIIEPEHCRLSVSAQAAGLVYRRLQQVHMDHHTAALVRFGAHTAQKRLACTVRPARRQQDPRVLVVIGIVELIKEAEIGVHQRLLVKEDERACSDPQIGRQRLDELFPTHREFALIANAGGEREPNSGR